MSKADNEKRGHHDSMNIARITDHNEDNFGRTLEESTAALSLRSALIAYFGTYQAILRSGSLLLENEDDQLDFANSGYKSLYFTAITHMQHFF